MTDPRGISPGGWIRRPGPGAWAAVAVMLALVASLPALGSPFFADDLIYVIGNERLQGPLQDAWRLLFTRGNALEFLPIRDLSYRFDLAIFGPQSLGFQIHNLLLYACCCGAVWLCVRSCLDLLHVGGTGGGTRSRELPWICAATTALFAVHPAHVESVAWVSGRKEILSGLFGLLSLWQLSSALIPDRTHVRRLATSYVLFGLALASKATVMPIAVFALILAAMRFAAPRPDRSGLIRAVLISAPFLGLAGLSLVLTLAVGAETGVLVGDLTGSRPFDLLSRLDVASRVLGTLTGIAVAPFRLRLIYDVEQGGAAGTLSAILGAATVLAAGIGLLRLWRHRSAAGLGAAFFALTSLPYLQLIPFSTWSLGSERFLFVSVFGVALAAAAVSRGLGGRWGTVGIASLVVAGALATYGQSQRWADKALLLADAARYSPEHEVAQLNWITATLLPADRFDEAEAAASRVRGAGGREVLLRYVRAERALAEGRRDDAERHADFLARLISWDDAAGEVLLLLSRVNEERGDALQAIRYCHGASREHQLVSYRRRAEACLRRLRAPYAERLGSLRRQVAQPDSDLSTIGRLGNLEMELFLLADAVTRFRRILETSPDHPVARYNLGLVYARQRRSADAAREFERALRTRLGGAGLEGAGAWNNLGLALKNSGQIASAIPAFERALDSDPRHWKAAVNLGRLRYDLLDDRDGAREAFIEARRRIGGTGRDAALIDVYLRALEE